MFLREERLDFQPQLFRQRLEFGDLPRFVGDRQLQQPDASRETAVSLLDQGIPFLPTFVALCKSLSLSFGLAFIVP